jgi:hypothetical protein
MADPLSRLRGRFDRAIEWRVRAAVERSLTGDETERGSDTDTSSDSDRDQDIRAMRDDLATVSVQLTDQHRALAELVEQLDRRLAALERATRDA